VKGTNYIYIGGNEKMSTREIWSIILSTLLAVAGLIGMGYTLIKIDYILHTYSTITTLWVFTVSLIVENLGWYFLERDL
jgi:hypothetical protein